MTQRAILYARVSSDDRSKDGRNLAGQLEMGKEYAQERGYTIVAELAEDDRGASGARIDLPELTRVRDMAQTDKFDVLVVREIDRLSRNLAKQLIVEEELKRAGVSIEYVLGEYPDTPEGNLQKHVKAAVAEYEREKISERMTRGRRQKAKDGHVMVHGNPPYGYRLGELDGKRMLIPYEPEARIVRMIFEWYTVGDNEQGPMTMHAITQRLSKLRIPTTGDSNPSFVKQRGYGKWCKTTVARILKRETYAGTWYYGKWGKKHKVAVNVPSVVSRETWEMAQQRLQQNKENAKRNTRYDYLIRRRATCGHCGAKMAVRMTRNKGGNGVHFYYYCPVRSRPTVFARKCSQRYGFRADHVDPTIWDWVRGFLADSEALRRGLEERQAERERAIAPLLNSLAVTDDLIAKNRQKLDKLLDLYLSSDLDKETYTGRQKQLQITIQGLEEERAELVAQIEMSALTDEQIEAIVSFAAKVKEGLAEAEEDFDARRQMIEYLDVQVKLAIEEGEKVAHVSCVVGKEVLSIVSHSS